LKTSAPQTNTNNSSNTEADASGMPRVLQRFEPTRDAALARLQTVNPSSYARTRNALDGAVTGLSPYFTHGLLSVPEATRLVQARHPLTFDDKLVFEFAWREFFHHVWSRAERQGDAILSDMRSPPTWSGAYANTLPDDVREGRTGVPAIDTAVRLLYGTGYLHNHARMWLASYVVHVRKVHWRAGADWLYAHLLDGDLASNHLSWQWVAGTFSSKPYLFNADNVLRFAPARARSAWASPGTVIDQSYETLDTLARSKRDAGAERGMHPAVAEPESFSDVPSGLLDAISDSNQSLALVFRASSATDLVANLHPGETLALHHPWSLSPAEPGAATRRLGVIHQPAHALLPWSAARWEFVLRAMASQVDAVWVGDLNQLRASLGISSGIRLSAQACRFPGYREALARVATTTPEPHLLPNPPRLCRSFSAFYEQARRDTGTLPEWLRTTAG
jgi:deoxyribodipyrimidine photo-lyase